MGLKELVQSAIQTGFRALGNIPESVTYLSIQNTSVYDPNTGQYVRREKSYPLTLVASDYANAEIDGVQVKPNDQRFLFLQADLPVKPTLLDRIQRTDGRYWEIVAIRKDPTDATWELQARGLNG